MTYELVADSGDDGRRSRVDFVAEAIRAFQTGADREAGFRVLYRRYHRAMLRFFAGKGMSPEDCQDLTQETFFGVYRGLEAYRHRMRFEAWLYELAINTFRKRLRPSGAGKRSGQEVPVDGLNHEVLEASPEQLDAVVHDEQRLAVRRAVHELPEQMRQCLTLRLYHDLSYREIAAVMQIKLETAKAHLFQARRRLREKLAESSFKDQSL